ncbi:MAG: hypothetical protein P1R58_08815 [bacterium]|nr:hypothetical protein [bacterium]
MRNLRWYYILSIVVGLVALVAVITWIFRTTDLLGRLANSSSEQLEELDEIN